MMTHNRGSYGGDKMAPKDTFSLKTLGNHEQTLMESEKALENLSIEIQEHFLLEQRQRIKGTKENLEWRSPITMKDSANRRLLLEIEEALATFPIERQKKFLTEQSKRIERQDSSTKGAVKRSPTTFSYFLLLILMSGFFAIVFHSLRSPKPQADIRSSLEQQQLTYAMDQSSTDLLINKFEQWSWKGTRDPLVIAIVGSAIKVESYIEERLSILKEASANEDLEILRVDQATSRVDLYEHFARDLSSQRQPSLSVVLGIEKLKWDSPLSLHAWGDDGQPLTDPPAENSLIILGVSVEEEITEQCTKFLQKYLLEKWKANGGTYSMITPIVNSRIDYAFCL